MPSPFPGMDPFLEHPQSKQGEILYGKVHLVEIDLLRGGEHTAAVPRDRLAGV